MQETGFLTVSNRGQDITATNFFDSKQGRLGFFFLSWNAGAGRLLVPESKASCVAEMRNSTLVIVSVGPWSGEGRGVAGMEVLFEDNTDTPFAIHMTARQSDRVLPERDHGKEFPFTVWTREGEQLRLPGKSRKVGRIPCLQPWGEHPRRLGAPIS